MGNNQLAFLTPATAAIKTPAPTAPGGTMEDLKCERETPLTEYQRNIVNARRNLAWKLADAFEVLDQISEKEFLEVIKTLSDGVTASDLIEKFRKYKATNTVPKKQRRKVKGELK